MKRLFFGLKPDRKTRQQCTDILQAANRRQNRPVPAANLHVTLVFLGLLTKETETVLVKEAAAAAIPKINIVFDQLSYWQKPGILCLTASHTEPELLSLVDQLTTIAKKLSIKVDERPYLPHVTLARKAKAPIELSFEPIIWQADSFCLFESCSSDNGVEYRVLNSWRTANADVDFYPVFAGK